MATEIRVHNEEESQSSRFTREGRKITYRLKVIQEPERARACGSGAKSSADRRPVDPPPIVQLVVYEGEGADQQEITFPYSANFFLFATLENARTIAQGRLPAPASFPVLTGTPVAGMAYLDRPDPAGYFIFPDLSVRHEGRYRLSFALYEELKDQKDMDVDQSQAIQVQAAGIDAHVTHRLEVKSKPFTVFSAKKFPGLAESTALSREIAEQGCRVRIRRDVRMRRREEKGGDGKDYDEFDADRSRRSITAEVSRPGTAHSHDSYHAIQRRPSMQEIAQGCQPPFSQAMGPPPAQPTQYQGVPQYSNAPPQHYAPQYASQHQPPQSMMQPPSTSYSPVPPQTYQPQPPPPPPQPQQLIMPQQYGYNQNQSYPQHGYEQHPHSRRESMEYPTPTSDYSRPSFHQQPHTPTYPAQSPMMPSYNHNESVHRQPHLMPPLQPAVPSTSAPGPHLNGYALAPLKTDKVDMSSPPYQMNGSFSSSPHDMQYGHAGKYTPQTPHAGAKRTYSDTFDTKHLNQPLRQGARPTLASEDYRAAYDDNSDDADAPEARAMSYRRADGTSRSRRVPQLMD
ncbi:hypothetical protein EJ05DRAFT_488347 [Pseudovirgaria hyperparasitica]|uniref:Velvet domain-containing protein n=1 Tax=Pseudovirgaria hyperparasitica TaxID=470096 RepID=A0A6A6VZE7_9PEZI|nr:uncharacterized protein EJ05DRAFT_488347 [Pseudovirgaria hyperparasitica]KAF2755605.1 hypothetical protein EJ05DRAFT_488347 [Pseudovirgaria hyperparasitica]